MRAFRPGNGGLLPPVYMLRLFHLYTIFTICGVYVTRSNKSLVVAAKLGFLLFFRTSLSILAAIECSTGGNHDFDKEDSIRYCGRDHRGDGRSKHRGAGG